MIPNPSFSQYVQNRFLPFVTPWMFLLFLGLFFTVPLIRLTPLLKGPSHQVGFALKWYKWAGPTEDLWLWTLIFWNLSLNFNEPLKFQSTPSKWSPILFLRGQPVLTLFPVSGLLWQRKKIWMYSSRMVGRTADRFLQLALECGRYDINYYPMAPWTTLSCIIGDRSSHLFNQKKSNDKYGDGEQQILIS